MSGVLNLSRRCRRHSGTTRVRGASEGMTVGKSLTVSPIIRLSSKNAMTSDTIHGSVTDGKRSIQRRRLLVVREDFGDLAASRAFFESFAYEVVSCSSHEQAARSLQSEGFDFVLLNEGSPRLDWRGVLEHVMAINRRMPVLVVTRCIDMPSYLDAMQLGALDYVEEPLNPPDIVRLIEAHLPLQPRASERREGHD